MLPHNFNSSMYIKNKRRLFALTFRRCWCFHQHQQHHQQHPGELAGENTSKGGRGGKLWLLLFAFALWSCGNKQTAPSSNTIGALTRLAPSINKNTKAVIVVDDNSCIGCNQAFAGFIADYISRKDVLFIVSANPNKVDISPFLVPGLHNVYNDYEQTLFSRKIITASTIFVLHNGKIDTAVTINPQSIGDVGKFMDGVLQ
jgi:hypothetical protein